MKSEKRKITRRDYCGAISRRMITLTTVEAASAWFHLSGALEGLEKRDIPKFQDLTQAIRRATIFGRRKHSTK